MKLVVNNDKAIPESGRGVSNRKTDHVRATILEMNEKGDWVGFTDEKEARNFYSRAYSMSQRGETKGSFVFRTMHNADEPKKPVFYKVWRIN